MYTPDSASPISRRSALRLGAAFTGGVVAASALGGKSALAQGNDTTPSKQVQQQIESIIGAPGRTFNGVLMVEVKRTDIANVSLHGIPVPASFLLNGVIFFQKAPSSNGDVMINADFCLKPSELDPFIHTLIQNNITFQAEHQHFYDFSPLVWFVHFRAMGKPGEIAHGIKAALNKTSTPFPQKKPPHPTTPLPAEQLGNIIGAKPHVGGGGVITFFIPRSDSIRLGGRTVNPYLNVASNVHIMPHKDGAVVVPDYAMVASEVNKVVGYALDHGWDIGCLYNQETDEHPQLYWSHHFKVGNPQMLAKEVHNGLAMLNSRFMS